MKITAAVDKPSMLIHRGPPQGPNPHPMWTQMRDGVGDPRDAGGACDVMRARVCRYWPDPGPGRFGAARSNPRGVHSASKRLASTFLRTLAGSQIRPFMAM